MKPLFLATVTAALFAVAAPAQSQAENIAKMKAELDQMVVQSKIIGLSGSVMGPAVKGAPYSATEVTETTQTLADGTRIHNQSQTKVWRDGEGRVRRETPDQITIMDPVAGATWLLDPKSLTGKKVTLSSTRTFAVNKKIGDADGANTTVEVHSDNGQTSVMINGKPADPAAVREMKARGELDVPPPGDTNPLSHVRVMTMPVNGDLAYIKRVERGATQSESLGKQTIEGVESEGTRSTSTIAAGAIGNDRPIQTVNERWYSPELQTVIMTTHTDPRTGEETFRLINVVRGEPGADLFQVPAGYHMAEKM